MERVAIIGMGVSGSAVLLAYVKAMKSHPDYQVQIDCYDSPLSFGKGKAFREQAEQAIINSRTHQISYDVDRILDFKEWLSSNQPSLSQESYVSRGLFGQYLHERSQALVEASGAQLHWSKVQSLTWLPKLDKWLVTTSLDDQGFEQVFDRVHLCCGELPSQDPYGLQGHPHYIGEVYPLEAIPQHLNQAQRLAILGSGLSAIDVAKYLYEHFTQPSLTFVSRQGYFPSVRGKDYQLDFHYLTDAKVARLLAVNGGRFSFDQFQALFEAELARFDLEYDAFMAHYFLPGRAGMEMTLHNPQQVGLMQAILLQVSVVMSQIWPAMSQTCRRQFNQRYQKALVCFRNPMPATSAQELLLGMDQGRIQLVAGLKQIDVLDQGFKLQTQDYEYEADWLFNATGMDFKLQNLGEKEALFADLLDKQYGQVDTAGGLSLNYQTLNLISPRFGEWSTLHGHGLLVNGAIFMNNSTNKIQEQAQRLIDRLVKEWQAKE
ncbi:FAD/NAD(P)-binding protein [Vaginisenegalia massiliensis]|uniref:FAD/NAD(P)-binding protein n=1 Tax=Vaginisenegalia massiliensis TaxID=2058294 RepID=UPI000F5232FA|nr:FAD/NAD(P)-binding protein [Vaginisenegalia massiliensis]